MANPTTKEGLCATVRYRTRSKMQLPVLDINIGGCMVEARGWSVKPQERVSIQLPGLAFISAVVIWIEDQRAGLAFDESLYGPTLESLLA
ncbi:MAG: PilZ domain-containing protein [Erythrobacter sp.]